jgi:plasmid stabilization system protein ParE
MRVRWTEPATRDLTQICDYIEEHDTSSTARRVAISIYERLSALTEFPEQGRQGRKSGTRELIFTGLPYLDLPHPRGRSGNPPNSTRRAEVAVMNWSEI